MKNITAFIGLGLIVVFLLLGFLGYNRIIGNQGRQEAIFELTAKQIEEMNTRHQIQLDSLESLKSLILHQDSLIQKQNEKIDYLRKQNDAIFHRYSSISIDLPDL